MGRAEKEESDIDVRFRDLEFGDVVSVKGDGRLRLYLGGVKVAKVTLDENPDFINKGPNHLSVEVTTFPHSSIRFPASITPSMLSDETREVQSLFPRPYISRFSPDKLFLSSPEKAKRILQDNPCLFSGKAFSQSRMFYYPSENINAPMNKLIRLKKEPETLRFSLDDFLNDVSGSGGFYGFARDSRGRLYYLFWQKIRVLPNSGFRIRVNTYRVNEEELMEALNGKESLLLPLEDVSQEETPGKFFLMRDILTF